MHKAKPTVKMRSPMTPEPLNVLSKNLSMAIPTNTGGDRGQEQGQPEIAGPNHNLVGKVSGKHKETGMGHVKNVHHADDQGDAGCNQEKKHPIHDSMYSLGHIHGSSWIHLADLSKKNLPDWYVYN